MKRISFLLLMFISLLGCDSDRGLNCFQAAGDIIQEEFDMPSFTKVVVNERVQLIIEQGDTQKVIVETGKNLMNDIELSVVESRLEIINQNGCNVVRDYGITKVFITVPDLREIRNSSGLPVESIGKLVFPRIFLLSDDGDNIDQVHIDGDFDLHLESENVQVISSGVSNFKLRGTSDGAYFAFYAGDSRMDAGDFLVKNLSVFHRGSNKMIVYPIDRLGGEILNSGDVVSKNRPPIVEVEELYTGRLIFDE
ncbi:MAG: hypothetical protein ACI86C_001080 [Candidatus Latescibacterota bacterium]|jgi:hypothetical protein